MSPFGSHCYVSSLIAWSHTVSSTVSSAHRMDGVHLVSSCSRFCFLSVFSTCCPVLILLIAMQYRFFPEMRIILFSFRLTEGNDTWKWSSPPLLPYLPSRSELPTNINAVPWDCTPSCLLILFQYFFVRTYITIYTLFPCWGCKWLGIKHPSAFSLPKPSNPTAISGAYSSLC